MPQSGLLVPQKLLKTAAQTSLVLPIADVPLAARVGIYSQMSEAANLEAEKAWVTGTGSPSALYPGKMLASESGKSIIDYTTSKKDASLRL